MIDWSAWISAGSAVVSAIMAGITVWWPWHNRPQADWTLLKYSTHPDTPLSATVPGLDGWLERRGEREPDFICGIYNSGDGAAYDVEVEGGGCKAYFLQITDDGTNTKFLTPSQIAQVESTDTNAAATLMPAKNQLISATSYSVCSNEIEYSACYIL